MKHQIRCLTFQPGGAIDLSQEEFNEILNAKRHLDVAQGIEEKFNLLLENYFEFERELLEITLRRMLFADINWSSSMDDIFAVNRRLANLLSSGRSYIDQLKHDVAKLYGRNSDPFKAVESALTNESEHTLGYRTMDSIRDYAQHSNFPVGGLIYGRSLREVNGKELLEHTITTRGSLSEWRKDPKLKQELLSELQHVADDVSLTPLVREYVEALGRIQAVLRNATKEAVAGFDNSVRSAVERAANELGAKYVAVARITDDGEVAEEEQLVRDVIDRRQYLERYTGKLSGLTRQYVTSMVE